MATIESHRKQFEYSGKHLRRARRLWRRFIKPTCENASGSQLMQTVRHAKERGLFATNTFEYDIAWATLHSFAQIDYGSRAGDKFSRWLAEHGWHLGTLRALQKTA